MTIHQPNPIDVHVGGRVKMRRLMLGMSQETLGEHLGVSFQQIQKYEKGRNRIGASRLQHIARVLAVPVSFFFEDAPGSGPAVVPRFAPADRLDVAIAKAAQDLSPTAKKAVLAVIAGFRAEASRNVAHAS